ncbi:GntR family transcriptional regulator [Sabulicella rubraurantiaca]|uniref:GntR family transcriptional regulator n=1 Tax=Sabulicella rubraurantiaca TaxID=2811429 RepID=UPI001A9596AB|nr:GntR family transcriptional regulator [Sabulicella rubraurantiaca]
MPARRPPKRQLGLELAILLRTGDFRAGEWLRQIDLEHRLNANRFEVRTALSELALRGIVEHVPFRGFRVAVTDMKRLKDLLSIRALLEVDAALAAMPHLDEAALAKLEALAAAFEHATVHGSYADWSQTNLDFHDTLYSWTPNRIQAEMIIEARDRARLWPKGLWPSFAALQQSAAGHRRILAALTRRDPTVLAAEIRSHIMESAVNLPSEEAPDGRANGTKN